MKSCILILVLVLGVMQVTAQTNLAPSSTVGVTALLTRGQVLFALPNRETLANGDIAEPFAVYEERVFFVHEGGEAILATNYKSLGRYVTNIIVAPKHPDPPQPQRRQ